MLQSCRRKHMDLRLTFQSIDWSDNYTMHKWVAKLWVDRTPQYTFQKDCFTSQLADKCNYSLTYKFHLYLNCFIYKYFGIWWLATVWWMGTKQVSHRDNCTYFSTLWTNLLLWSYAFRGDTPARTRRTTTYPFMKKKTFSTLLLRQF